MKQSQHFDSRDSSDDRNCQHVRYNESLTKSLAKHELQSNTGLHQRTKKSTQTHELGNGNTPN
jgi:hypothetical protein